jgi:hypothetical protein
MTLTAVPAGAHLKSVDDGNNDSYEAGNINGTAHVTPMDMSGASFREKPRNYKITVTFHDALDVGLLCSEKACGDLIEGHGFVVSNLYRLKGKETKNYYIVQVAQDGSGNLIAAVLRVTNDGADPVDVAIATMSDDGSTMTIKVPRKELKGHVEGRKIYWNVTSVYWYPAKTGFCEYNEEENFAAACVDWIPDAADAPHKLQN